MAKKNRSPEWDRFMYEFFDRSDYEQWHDGIDLNILLQLTEEEQIEAEKLLIESVEKNGQWPTRGLAALESKKAIPVLKKKLDSGYGIIKIRCAYALEKIVGTGEYLPVLYDELFNNVSPYDRLEVAMNLREFPTKEVVDNLFKAMLDEDYLVRAHAADSLLGIHGFNPEISNHDDIFRYIVSKWKGVKSSKDDYITAVELLKEKLKDKKYKDYLEKE